MKKLLSLVVAVVIGIGTTLANPVDVNTAMSLGQKFVQANFEKTTRANLELYYTVTSDNGAPCAFVFNIGNEGFVIVAASDNVRPILGYSENGPFDATNPRNGAMYMLSLYKNSISYAIESNLNPTPDVVGMWKSLKNCGKLSNKRANKVGPLVETKWNQDSPYNLYSPAASGGPGGRCYAGCVACAMSQLMKYWNHPIHGTGSHSYSTSTYGGTLSANFGATTYDWENMPISLGSSSTQTQIEAVATLMYHCAVAVNMNFKPNGSGAYSDDVPAAMGNYFDYGYCIRRMKQSYPVDTWVSMLKDEFDLGRPVYYSGTDPDPVNGGGHAFVCDGYDENDFLHFNFGWGGSDDDWYAVDGIDYTQNTAAIFNYVPSAVYQATAQAPTNLTITKPSDLALEATLSWTAPTSTFANQPISPNDIVMVVLRNDVEIYRTQATSGTMTFVDTEVPCYSTFEYKVYAIYNNVNGKAAKVTESFGPRCQWNVIVSTTNMNGGWKGAYLVAYDGAGSEIGRVTMTNSTSTTVPLEMTLGRVSFAWIKGTDNVGVTFKIKDENNTVVYQFSGNSNDVPAGVLYSGQNRCGNAAPTGVPPTITATQNGNNIILSWEGSAKTNYGFNIYRDGLLCKLSNGNEFVDEAPQIGGHCYQMCILGEGGESDFSNETCATVGEGCNPPRNLTGFHQTNHKPGIRWEAPENATGLNGYYIYRKENADGSYERKKITGANVLEFKDNAGLTYGNWYYYKVVAYYKAIDCSSAPAQAADGDEFFVKVLYSEDGVEEYMAQEVKVYPNPAKDVITVKAEGITSVMVYNSLGQKVFEKSLNADEMSIGTSGFESGIYMIRIIADGNEITRKVSVVK